MEPPEDMSCGAGVIILHEIGIDPEIPKGVAVPRLEKETSGITEDLWLQ